MIDSMTHVASFAVEDSSGYRYRLENWAEGISNTYVSLVYEEWEKYDKPDNLGYAGRWVKKNSMELNLDSLTKMVKLMNLVVGEKE